MNSAKNEVKVSQALKEYGSYLLQYKIDEYTLEILSLSNELQMPLLKFFQHLSPDQIFEISKPNQSAFLSHLSEGDISCHLEHSLQKWLSDQLPLIGKYDVQAKDLTLAMYIRSKALKHFLLEYTVDLNEIIRLRDEIDDLILAYNTAFTDAYINILKDKANEEANFSSTVINASPGITFIFDLVEQKEVFITGKVRDVTGHSPEEVLAMSNPITEIIHPDDFLIIEGLVKEVMADVIGNTYSAEYRIKKKDGAYIWMRCYAVVYKRNADGTPLQLLGVGYNVTRERETSIALEKKEKQLLEAQAIGRIGSFDWDIINDVSISTPELRKIFEADHQQTLEEMLSNVHEDDKQSVRNAIAEAFRTGNYSCEYRYQSKSGMKIIDTRGKVLFTEEGKPKTMIGTIQDITERKQIENELIAKTSALERSNEQLQQFAYIASHDLKEPLRKIAMFSNLIITSDWDNLSERTRANVKKVSEASLRMQRLIEGILNYSYLSVETPPELHSLEQSLQTAIDTLEFAIAESKAIITSDGLPDAVVVPHQMQQLFQNLIANSLKFSKNDVRPQIAISHVVLPANKVRIKPVFNLTKYLQITIEDNGIGFSNKAGEKIFGLFQRLHSKSQYEGSGLGLAICQKIVENHGGAIEAFSEEGRGAKFVITIPNE